MSIEVKQKQAFIKWFLKEHQMKRRECVWILNYLLSHEELLERVRFVEEAHFCPRAMIMSTTTSIKGIPFRFYKKSIMTADVEKSFHDLRLNTEDDLYLQLNFPEPFQSPLYLAVLEDNKFVSASADSSNEHSKVAEELIQYSLEQFHKRTIEAQIDEAIDRNDREKFLELTNLFKESQLN